MAELKGRERAAYVQSMFGRIARKYDVMNRLMTLGQDRAWRRYAVQQAAIVPGARVLDIGTGTGDLALETLRQSDRATAIGADFTLPMMQVGRSRAGGERVQWCAADALRLPFPDGAFDAIVSGYLVRNVSDAALALCEQARVVKPGGRVVCLEAFPEPGGLLRPLIQFHSRAIIPLLGGLIAGDRAAYSYLPESVRRFKTPDALASIMRSAGLKDVHYRRFMFGAMAVHVGVKSGDGGKAAIESRPTFGSRISGGTAKGQRLTYCTTTALD